MAFRDLGNAPAAQAGTLSLRPLLSVPIRGHDGVHLLLDNGLFLRVERGVQDESGARVGTAITKSALPFLTGTIVEAGVHGATAELAVCAPLDTAMQCFPLTLTQSRFSRIERTRDGQPLPMSHALDGKTGVAFARDYRGEQVIAAYTPSR